MDGIIIINKPEKQTSHDIVYKAKKIFNKKVGHTGTLDPMATGVLPLLIGKCTLCSKYLINHDKIYEVNLQLGKKTDTADSEGKTIQEIEVNENLLIEKNIEEVLSTFIGKQKQIPPIYSAIKVKGKKLYQYARKGIDIQIDPRNIEIYEIKLLKINKDKKQIQFKVKCSKGTYIRSLCEDIAKKLGTIGYMSKLNRLQVGNFNIDKAIEIEELEKNINNKQFIKTHFITLEDLFKQKQEIHLDESTLKQFLNGVKIMLDYEDEIYRIYTNNKFIGIGVIKNNSLKRDIILD